MTKQIDATEKKIKRLEIAGLACSIGWVISTALSALCEIAISLLG